MWYALIQYVDGTDERMYCRTRQEARDCCARVAKWPGVKWTTVHQVR